MTYTHLTKEERYQIQALHQIGRARGKIARQLGRHPCTIGRELRRSGSAALPGSTGSVAEQRQRSSRNARTIEPECWLQVQSYVRLWLSPEQICGRLTLEGAKPVSHDSIYRHIYRDKCRRLLG